MSPLAALIIAVLVLSVIAAILLFMVIRAVNEILFLREDLQQATDTEHAKCIGAVTAFIGNEWAAQILEIAADDYSSPKAHRDIDRIQRIVYKPGGEPVPALWLRERAVRLRVEQDWAMADDLSS